MESKKSYNFGEKAQEWSAKLGKNVDVWKNPKYEYSKKKVIEMLESKQYKDVLDESDFWILKNATKNGGVAYTGLIISHNGCLKINDVLDDELKFKPDSVSLDKEGYNDSLVYSYCNTTQGLYEVGEVSKSNCQNAYPYAMAFKRLFDRVVLKNSKLAYAGVYSDSEAEEFRKEETKEESKSDTKENINYMELLAKFCKEKGVETSEVAKVYKLNAKSTNEDFKVAYEKFTAVYNESKEKNGKNNGGV